MPTCKVQPFHDIILLSKIKFRQVACSSLIVPLIFSSLSLLFSLLSLSLSLYISHSHSCSQFLSVWEKITIIIIYTGKSYQISSSLSSVVSKQWNLRSAKTSGLGDTSSTVEKKKCCDAVGRPSAHTSPPPRPTKRVNEKSLKDAPAGVCVCVCVRVSKLGKLCV